MSLYQFQNANSIPSEKVSRVHFFLGTIYLSKNLNILKAYEKLHRKGEPYRFNR